MTIHILSFIITKPKKAKNHWFKQKAFMIYNTNFFHDEFDLIENSFELIQYPKSLIQVTKIKFLKIHKCQCFFQKCLKIHFPIIHCADILFYPVI